MGSAKIGVYLRAAFFQYVTSHLGPVAQLIERVVRNDEVVGLIPICSTILRQSGAMVKDAIIALATEGLDIPRRRG